MENLHSSTQFLYAFSPFHGIVAPYIQNTADIKYVLTSQNFVLNPNFINGPSQTGGAAEDMTPTVGFNMKKVTRGNVTIKLWDIGGQPKFRSMWERYCRGVNAVVYETRGRVHLA